jgi:integration host factor subunit beta
MTKSELIYQISMVQKDFHQQDIEDGVNHIIEAMIQALASDERIEIRGFGSFTIRHRKPRIGRNPRTGESVDVEMKHVPHFKPGKALKKMVDDSKDTIEILE